MSERQREIDQGVEGELHYHGRGVPDDITLRAGSSERKRGGLFRIFTTNPALLLILVDILVIILVLTLVFPFIRRKSSAESFAGFELSLHGFSYENTATVSLVVTSLPVPEPETASENPSLQVRFVIPSDEEYKKIEKTVEEPLPRIGESKVLRTEIKTEEGRVPDLVQAEVRIGGEDIILQKELLTE